MDETGDESSLFVPPVMQSVLITASLVNLTTTHVSTLLSMHPNPIYGLELHMVTYALGQS